MNLQRTLDNQLKKLIQVLMDTRILLVEILKSIADVCFEKTGKVLYVILQTSLFIKYSLKLREREKASIMVPKKPYN